MNLGVRMPQTYGVPIEEIERGIKHGVRKVNIDTDCRLAMAGVIRKVAQTTPSEFDLRKFLKPAQDAMEALCRNRFERFGTAGNAHKINGLCVIMQNQPSQFPSGILICTLHLQSRGRLWTWFLPHQIPF